MAGSAQGAKIKMVVIRFQYSVCYASLERHTQLKPVRKLYDIFELESRCTAWGRVSGVSMTKKTAIGKICHCSFLGASNGSPSG